LSHGWLKVEEARECSSWKEKEEVKVKRLSLHDRTTALPFVRQGEQVTLVKREKKEEVGRLHAQQMCGRKVFSSCSGSHRPWPLFST
jgi:hypothetical protein